MGIFDSISSSASYMGQVVSDKGSSVVSNMTSGSMQQRVMTLMIVLLVVAGIYYGYKLFTGTTDPIVPGTDKSVSIMSNKVSGEFSPGVQLNKTSGASYCVSTWVYVSEWSTSSEKRILEIGELGGDADFGMYFDVKTNQVHVDVKHMDAPAGAELSITAERPNVHRCTVNDVPLQRWVHIAVCIVDKYVDVYINGKLSRSCLMANVSAGCQGSIQVGAVTDGSESSFTGHMSRIRVTEDEHGSYTWSAGDVYSQYNKGPATEGNFLINYLSGVVRDILSYMGFGRITEAKLVINTDPVVVTKAGGRSEYNII